MEKTFVLKSAIPTLATNGKVAVYSTLDTRVNMILIIKNFQWENRKKEEVFRCPRCNCYILPGDKGKLKEEIRYHGLCQFLKKEENKI